MYESEVAHQRTHVQAFSSGFHTEPDPFLIFCHECPNEAEVTAKLE